MPPKKSASQAAVSAESSFSQRHIVVEKLGTTQPGPVKDAIAQIEAAGKTVADVDGDELKTLLTSEALGKLQSCLRSNLNKLKDAGQDSPFAEYGTCTTDTDRRKFLIKFILDPSLGTYAATETTSLYTDDMDREDTMWVTEDWLAGPNGVNNPKHAKVSKRYDRYLSHEMIMEIGGNGFVIFASRMTRSLGMCYFQAVLKGGPP